MLSIFAVCCSSHKVQQFNEQKVKHMTRQYWCTRCSFSLVTVFGLKRFYLYIESRLKPVLRNRAQIIPLCVCKKHLRQGCLPIARVACAHYMGRQRRLIWFLTYMHESMWLSGQKHQNYWLLITNRVWTLALYVFFEEVYYWVGLYCLS